MKYSYYSSIIIGVGLCFYAEYINVQYLLILGICLLLFGLYKVSAKLSSNKEKEILEVKNEKEKHEE